jgi:hypothetical protein
MAGGGGLAGDSRKHDSGHYFDLGLVGEKESEEGDTFKGSGRGAGGRGSGRWRHAVAELWRASSATGKGEGRGNQAGEDPHPKAELRRWLAATAEQRGGSCDDDRGAAARLGFTRQKAAAAVLAGPRAQGGSFIGRP